MSHASRRKTHYARHNGWLDATTRALDGLPANAVVAVE